MSQTALIAGATGYLGRYTVKAFKQAGYHVRVLARNRSKLAQPGAALAPAIDDCVDDVHIGDVTQPETLKGICDGVDIVFSSISLMGQKSALTWHDVDYQGNVNLLNEALAAGVKKFIFVSVYNAEKVMRIPIVKAHEDFAADLAASGMDYAIIRPTGYFSDMGEFFDMAQSGRVYLIGDGQLKINPIHGADLAQVSLNAVENPQKEIAIGGPDIYTWNEVAKIALAVADKPNKVSHIPLWLANTGINLLRPFKQHTAQLWDFFVSSSALDNIAPQSGTHHLEDHYRALNSTQKV